VIPIVVSSGGASPAPRDTGSIAEFAAQRKNLA